VLLFFRKLDNLIRTLGNPDPIISSCGEINDQEEGKKGVFEVYVSAENIDSNPQLKLFFRLFHRTLNKTTFQTTVNSEYLGNME
jgi:hypothetical protein